MNSARAIHQERDSSVLLLEPYGARQCNALLRLLLLLYVPCIGGWFWWLLLLGGGGGNPPPPPPWVLEWLLLNDMFLLTSGRWCGGWILLVVCGYL